MKYWQVVKAVTQRMRPSRSRQARGAEVRSSSRDALAHELPPPTPAAELIFIITSMALEARATGEGKPPSGPGGLT